jgi:hypothetical protein
MSKAKTLLDRVVNRAVEEAEIKKQIEDLKRQRCEVLENLAGITRQIRGEFDEEPEAAADDDDDDDWEYEETEEWDE